MGEFLMAKAPLFRATSGLNNVLEPHRLRYGDDGGCPLAEAVNVIIDDGGGVRRRKGRKLLFDGPVHSLWSWGPYCFFVSEGALYRRMASGANVTVHASCGDLPMFFEKFAGHVYCSNGPFRAILKDMTIESWSATVPQQYRSDTRTLGLPPSFTRLIAHAGRMYLVDGMFLWETEPHLPGCVDMSREPISFGTMIQDGIAVRGGIFISTEWGVKFLAGSSREDFVTYDVHDSPAVPGTTARITGDAVGDGDMMDGMCAIWTARDGVCLGSEEGKVTNVTSRRLVFDKAISGAGIVIPGQYFFSLEVE